MPPKDIHNRNECMQDSWESTTFIISCPKIVWMVDEKKMDVYIITNDVSTNGCYSTTCVMFTSICILSHTQNCGLRMRREYSLPPTSKEIAS